MKIKKRLLSLTLAATMALGLMSGMSMTALADRDTSYTLTIPSSLTVTKSGWNEQTDGITAKLSSGDAFDDSKKLTVTAASNNKGTNAEYEWKLVSDTNTVGYNLAASGDDSSSYNSTATPASWEFSASEITTAGTKKTLGIIVEDYSTKPAGTYTDTVTFTAEIESKGPKTYTSLTNGDVLHVGDTVDSSTEYIFSNVSASFNPYFTFTLLRADITGDDMDPIVTEKDDGVYYFFKCVDRQSGDVAYTAHSNPSGGVDGFAFSATSTSDGLVITQSGSNWNIAVHEP